MIEKVTNIKYFIALKTNVFLTKILNHENRALTNGSLRLTIVN